MTEAEFLAAFHRQKDRVYRLALSYTKSVPDAEDVCQTVFLKLLQQPTRAAGGGKGLANPGDGEPVPGPAQIQLAPAHRPSGRGSILLRSRGPGAVSSRNGPSPQGPGGNPPPLLRGVHRPGDRVPAGDQRKRGAKPADAGPKTTEIIAKGGRTWTNAIETPLIRFT